MNKPRLLITGGSGLLGINWALNTRNNFDVILLLNKRLISLKNSSTIQYKISSFDDVKFMLEKIKPDIVINSAGLTSVEGCENDPELAKAVNVDVAHFLSKGSSQLGLPFVQISTDHLFDGQNLMTDESAPLTALNVYGATKAMAEEAVLRNHSNALIIRTNFYGWGTTYRHSFSDRILFSLRKGQQITMFEDVFYTPILAEYLVKYVHELLLKKEKGIFNVVGNERISKYEFSVRLASVFNLDPMLINKAKAVNNNNSVNRPLDMSLSNIKLSKTIQKNIPSLMEQLTRLYEQEKLGIANEILSI